MTKPVDNIFTEVRKNFVIIMTIVGLIAGWVSLSARVDANELEVANVRILIERIIVLEEHDKDIRADITEIKDDIKIIKGLLR